MCWASIHADKMQRVRRPLGNESFIKIQQGFLRRMILVIQAFFFLFTLIFLSVGVGWSKCWEGVCMGVGCKDKLEIK